MLLTFFSCSNRYGSLDIRQSHDGPKKKSAHQHTPMLSDIKLLLDSVLDEESFIFQQWCQLYSSTTTQKSFTLSASIIKTILTWPAILAAQEASTFGIASPSFDILGHACAKSSIFDRTETERLLENLKRCLLRIFHKVKRCSAYIS